MQDLRDPLGTRFWVAKEQASLLPNSQHWLGEVRQIELLLEGPDPPAVRLATLLLKYVNADEEAGLEARASYLQGGDGQRADLYSELVRLVHEALVSLGSAAREPLLCEYSACEPDSAQRWWLLLTLAKLGDPCLDRFFRRIRLQDGKTREVAEHALALIHRKQTDPSGGAETGPEL